MIERRWIGAAQACDLGQRLSGVRGLGREASEQEVVRGRDLAQDELGRLPVREIALRKEHGQRRLPI